MTAQFPEKLYYRDRVLVMWSYPSLNTLENVIDHAFIAPNTALYRGYTGTWSVHDGRLCLVDIQGKLTDGREVSLEILAPGCGGKRAFAKNFTGTINCPLEGGVGPYDACEKMLRLHVTDGIVVGEEELDRAAMAREHERYQKEQALRDATRTRERATSTNPKEAWAAAMDFIEGKALPTDPAAGEEILRRLAATGYAPAIAKLGVALASGAIGSSDKAEVEQWLRAGVKVGDSEAMFTLASRIAAGNTSLHPFVAMCMYAMSSRVHAEASRELYKMSRTWVTLPSAQRAADAKTALDESHLLELGRLFLHGRGALKHPGGAATCFVEAAERGNVEGQLEIALMSMVGDGIPRDMRTAIAWLRRVGIEPLLDAALRLENLVVGQATVDGGQWLGDPGATTLDVKPKPRFTAQQVALLTEADNPRSTRQSEIAHLFETGVQLPRSEIDAIYWYARAADRNDSSSAEKLEKLDQERARRPQSERMIEGAEYADYNRLNFVGVRYVTGRGVRKDLDEATLWCSKAAVRGSMGALRQLRELSPKKIGQ